MARQIEHDLYKALIDYRFLFINKGTQSIDKIYDAVHKHFPNLCDDNYYCNESCSSGNNQPEWKHTIRNALQSLKSPHGTVSFTGKRRYWKFS